MAYFVASCEVSPGESRCDVYVTSTSCALRTEADIRRLCVPDAKALPEMEPPGLSRLLGIEGAFGDPDASLTVVLGC